MRDAWELGYHPVVIQYRGVSGIELTSPVTYGCGQYDDVIESIEYIYQEYCKEIDRKIFAIGFSIGGNWLGMGLAKHKNGLQNRITACALWQSPTILKSATDNLSKILGGVVNRHLGYRIKKVIKANLQYLQPSFEQNFGIDLADVCENITGLTDIDRLINWKVMKESSLESY